MALKRLTVSLSYLLSGLLLTGCQGLPLSRNVQLNVEDVGPYGLASLGLHNEKERQTTGWLGEFGDPSLSSLISLSVEQNFELNEARYRVEAALQQRKASNANLFPSISLAVDASRTRNNRPERNFTESYGAGFDLNWEADLWGKNYDAYKAQDLLLQAEAAQLEASRLSLAGQVAKAWYQVVSSQLLTELFSRQVENLKTNLDIIGSGYRRGINNALDVYLARSNLATEQSNLTSQQEQSREAIRTLQLLLGTYPSGQLVDLTVPLSDLPELPELADVSFTTDAVRYRYDLQASFLALAAQDRQLASAHKARFPSLNIIAGAGDSASDMDQLFDGRSLAWNVIGGLTQPIFAGGRLQAMEAQQLAILRQSEQRYLQALNTAFSEIEQALSNDQALRHQMSYLDEARVDAQAAEALAFDQYRQGLVGYIEVLEAQRRAFSAQSSLLNIRNQYLQNRINMYLALGANYQTGSEL